jgi:hypothetical protein
MMLKITTEEPTWSADQAGAVRQFFNTLPGQILLQRLFWFRPVPGALPSGPDAKIDPTLRIAQAEQLAGYEKAIATIIEHTVSPK